MTRNTKIDSSSVVLVSGGGRGVTSQCVIKVAEKYECSFILLGRSKLAETEPEWAEGCCDEAELKKRIMQDLIARGEKPTPLKVQKVFNSLLQAREIATTLAKIQQAGGRVEYLSVDVTDSCALQVALAPVVRRLGKITGIIHGAGNLADKLIEKKTAQDFETVYTTKIEGLESLLSCVEPSQLDFIVLFSSFVAFYGNAGQSDYALANEILNKTAYLLRLKYPSCHAVSIGWGPWDGGMVTPELKKHFAQLDIELIPVEIGVQMLMDELTSSSETAQILVMSNPIVAPPKQLDSELQTFRIRRKLTLTANPFLYDHVIGSKAVLPAMCGISWIANICEQLYPGYQFFSCSNYKVLKGIVFDETLAGEYILDLKEVDKSTPGEIDFEARIWSESTKGLPHYHYDTQIKLVQKIPQAAIGSLTSSQEEGMLMSPYQNGVLFHRRRFQGVKRILDVSFESLTALCNLASVEIRDQGQFPVQTFNPYTADSLLQCLLVWVRHFYDLGSLPLQVQKLEQFRAIPFDRDFYVVLEVQSKSETGAVATATAYDERGQIYLRSNIQVTASARLNSLFLNNSCLERELSEEGRRETRRTRETSKQNFNSY